MTTVLASRLETIRCALRQWDPIGVITTLKETDLPLDEYDTYAASLLSYVESGANAFGIAARLANIRAGSIGIGAPKPTKRELELAEKLEGWSQRGFVDAPDFRSCRDAV